MRLHAALGATPSALNVMVACYEQLLEHQPVVLAVSPLSMAGPAGYLDSLHYLGASGSLDADELQRIATALDTAVWVTAFLI